jgi:hypothetical protein
MQMRVRVRVRVQEMQKARPDEFVVRRSSLSCVRWVMGDGNEYVMRQAFHSSTP